MKVQFLLDLLDGSGSGDSSTMITGQEFKYNIHYSSGFFLGTLSTTSTTSTSNTPLTSNISTLATSTISSTSTSTTNETPFIDKLLQGSNVYYIIGGGSGVLLFCYILFCWCCTCIYCKKSRKRKQTYTFKGL